MYKTLSKFSCVIVPVCLVILSFGLTHPASAVATKEYGTIVQGSSLPPCFYMEDVSFGSKGYVSLRFKRLNDPVCKKKSEFYSAETVPKNKIRGVVGINGSRASDIVEILVEPDTQEVIIDTLDYYGRFIRRSHTIQRFIRAAKRQNSGWQNAWKQSEQKLQAQRSADKTPPNIGISTPSYTPGQKVVRVDSYQTYIRGKAVDNEGILQILVNGRKAGLKADGSFASKVKLKLGVNKVRIQAEDINGNVGQRILTIIRDEFIAEETLADVDMPPKTRMRNPDGVAVVIGVENYQYVSDATYAYNDAEVFREYLADTLGYKKSMIKIVTNSKATLAELNKLLGPNGWMSTPE
jgi:hypothetical protein